MTVLQLVLLISLVTNAALGWVYLGERDDAVAARSEVSAKSQELAGVRGAAEACSTSVDGLRLLADKRLLEAANARRQAGLRASERNRRADEILAAPAAVPGDACASAQARVDGLVKGRAAP